MANTPALDTQFSLPTNMLSEAINEVLNSNESLPGKLLNSFDTLGHVVSQHILDLKMKFTSVIIDARFEVCTRALAKCFADASSLVIQPSFTLDDNVSAEVGEDAIDSIIGLARLEFGNAHRCHMYMSADPDDPESPPSLVLRVSSDLDRVAFRKQRQAFFRRAMRELPPSLFDGLRVIGEAIESY
jgi:hypothetical protein